MKYYQRLLIRYFLWPKQSDGFLKVINLFSFLGIALGVATLIVVMSVMNGFRHELVEKTLEFNSHVTIYPTTVPFTDASETLGHFKNMRGVKNVIPLRQGEGMASFNGRSYGVLLRAMPWESLVNRTSLVNKNLMGSFQSFDGAQNKIGIGRKLAEKLRVRVGQTMTVTVSNGALTAFGRMPRLDYFEVAFIYESGVLEYDAGVVFLPYKCADKYLDRKGQIDAVEFFLNDPYLASSMLGVIAEKLQKPFRAVTWAEANKRFFEVVEIERNVMFLILSLIILIASFNIISGLVILVRDKTSSIAILKSMGVSTKSILWIFSMVGTLIGVLGTTTGVVLGFLVAFNLEPIRQTFQRLTGTRLFDQEFYFLAELPVRIDGLQIVCIVGMSLIFSYLASLYPAWRAAKLLPVEGLHHE